jgi:hypothetical protein
MTMPDVDLNFLARQSERIIADVGILRDENRVLTTMVTRLEEAQPRMLEQMRALQSLIGRMDDRFRRLENGGMSPEQVDAIANRLEPRLLGSLTELITQKLLVVLHNAIDERFEDIQRKLADIYRKLPTG